MLVLFHVVILYIQEYIIIKCAIIISFDTCETNLPTMEAVRAPTSVPPSVKEWVSVKK